LPVLLLPGQRRRRPAFCRQPRRLPVGSAARRRQLPGAHPQPAGDGARTGRAQRLGTRNSPRRRTRAFPDPVVVDDPGPLPAYRGRRRRCRRQEVRPPHLRHHHEGFR
ncbi:hypothetical protein LTR94_032835, partial [Friedmanniomyces endolithicus]